jgi:hypothetical protein
MIYGTLTQNAENELNVMGDDRCNSNYINSDEYKTCYTCKLVADNDYKYHLYENAVCEHALCTYCRHICFGCNSYKCKDCIDEWDYFDGCNHISCAGCKKKCTNCNAAICLICDEDNHMTKCVVCKEGFCSDCAKNNTICKPCENISYCDVCMNYTPTKCICGEYLKDCRCLDSSTNRGVKKCRKCNTEKKDN